MKRLFLIATLALASADVGWCTIDTYTNKSVVVGLPLTTIDATNFVNLNYFYIGTPIPYDFSNVRNYTNRSFMANPTSGFRFDTVPTVGNRYMATTFYNAALAVNANTNARVTAEYQLMISATNIINRGLLGVSPNGLLKLDGKNLDLSRGVLQVSDFNQSTNINVESVFDNEWGLNQVTMTPNNQVTAGSPSTPVYNVVQFAPQFTESPYIDSTNALVLTGDANTLLSGQVISEAVSNRSVQYIFVRNANTNIQASIRYASNQGQTSQAGSPRVPIIEWRATGTNTFGQVVTNTVYLLDGFAVTAGNSSLTENFPFASPPPQSLPIAPASYQPANFVITKTTPAEWISGTNPVPFVVPGANMWTTNTFPEPVVANYSGYAFTLTSITPDPSQISQLAVTNVRTGPGRIELNASGSLDLNLARIDGLNYLRINATNHFAGASNATISAAYTDLDLASTNGSLDTVGVLSSSVPRLVGKVQCFSVKWQNVVYYENGSTNVADFNILYVDAELEDSAPTATISLALHSTNAFISDPITILDKLNLDVRSLTIRDSGSIQIFPTDTLWPSSAPHLTTFTNFGYVDFLNSDQEMGLHGLDAGGNPVPYASFVNQGIIYNIGAIVLATNLVNGGYLYSAFGPLTLQSYGDLTLLPGGALYAPYSDLAINCHNLNVTNHDIFIGRGLSMSITGNLRAGTNQWAVYDGFRLLTKPSTGDFAETTITDTGFPFAEVLHTWAGEDRGASAAGFTNNAALGRLELNGGLSTLFSFSGAGQTSNAIYIDHLILTNYATQFDAQGGLSALNISPGMTVYYGEATINGGSIAEFLDGKHNGRLRWVSSHAGPFSGVNVVYPDGSTNFLNAALIASCNMDSDSDGLVNCIDPSPVPVPFQPQLLARPVSSPSAGMALSWTSLGGAKNRVYSTTNSISPQWQLITNIVTPAQTGKPALMEIVVPVNGISRFYRVGVEPAVP